MSLTTLTPFNTERHRFAAGDVIPPDADLAPHSLAELKQRHYVADEDTKAAKAAVKASK